MKRIFAVTAYVGVLAAGLAAAPLTSPPAAKKSQIMVHCPNGNQDAFVTPVHDTIAVGDSVVWRMTGQVTSDSLVITLKDADQTWPFSGAMPKGATSAQTGAARTKGTYGYNVHLQCRVPGGGTQPVTIDPDIIIE